MKKWLDFHGFWVSTHKPWLDGIANYSFFFILLHQEMDAHAKLIKLTYMNNVCTWTQWSLIHWRGKSQLIMARICLCDKNSKVNLRGKKHGFSKQSHTGIHYSFQHYCHSWQKRNAPMSLKKISIKINKIFLPLNSKDMRTDKFVGCSHRPDMYKIHKKIKQAYLCISFSSVFSQSNVTLFLRCSHSMAPWALTNEKKRPLKHKYTPI